MNVHVFQLI